MVQATAVEPRVNPESVLLKKIQLKVVKIEKIVTKNLGTQVVNEKKKGAQKKTLGVILAEEKLEKKKRGGGLLGKMKGSLPRTGIIDNVVNFMIFTLFGRFFDMAQGFLPKLVGLVNILKIASNIIGWFTGFIINSLSFFIDSGYKIYDNITGKSKEIKQLPFKQATEGFSLAFKNTLSATTDFIGLLTGQFLNNENVAQNPKEVKPKGAAVGGPIGVTRGNIPINKPITRELRSTKQPVRPRKEQVQKPKVGKDVGGEATVRSFYGSPKIGIGGIIGIFRPKNTVAQKTPVDSISSISTTLRSRNTLFGDIASVGSDIALGQKPEKSVYRNTAKDVVYLAQVISSRQENKMKASILGMAYGGTVPSSIRTISSQADMVDLVEVIIKKSVEERVNNALNEVKAPMVRRASEINQTRKSGYFDPMREGIGGGGGGGFNADTGDMGSPGGSYGGYAPPSGIQREIYNYLVNEKKMNDVQALGLMANINRESSFVPGIRERGGTGVGLFQWSHSRVQPFMRAVPDWEKNWKAQIDYALNEPQNLSGIKPGKYQSMQFKTPQEAAEWWMRKWERPADPRSGSIKHSEYLGSIPIGPDGKAKFRAPEKMDSGSIKVKGGIIPSTVISDRVGWRIHPVLGTRRFHRGNDYGAEMNDPISLIKPGVVTSIGNDSRGYGNYIEITHKDGSKSFYGHLSSIKVRQNQAINVGQVIGNVGSTGMSTGPHLHFEYTDSKGRLIDTPEHLTSFGDNTFRFGGKVVPSEVQKLAMKNGKEGYIDYNGDFIPKKWTNEDKKRFETLEGTKKTKDSPSKDIKMKIKQLKNGQSFDLSYKNEKFTIKKIGEGEGDIELLGNNSGVIYREVSKIINKTKNNSTIKKGQQVKGFAHVMTKKDGYSPTNNIKQRTKTPRTSRNTPKQNKKRTQTGSKKSPQRAWYDPRGWFGKKGGGIIGQTPSIPSGYTSYERYGGMSILAIQPMIIHQQVPIKESSMIPIPFPVSSGVNNMSDYRA